MKKIAGSAFAALFLANIAFADSYSLEVEGMRCQHCAHRAERELQTLQGVESVSFDLKAKQVELSVVDGQSLQEDQLREIIEGAGFTLVNAGQPAEAAQPDDH